jgi:hypothetical protein
MPAQREKTRFVNSANALPQTLSCANNNSANALPQTLSCANNNSANALPQTLSCANNNSANALPQTMCFLCQWQPWQQVAQNPAF